MNVTAVTVLDFLADLRYNVSRICKVLTNLKPENLLSLITQTYYVLLFFCLYFFVCLGRAGVSVCPRLEVMNSSKINKLGVYPREKRKCQANSKVLRLINIG